MLYKYVPKQYDTLLLRNARSFNHGDNSQNELEIMKKNIERLMIETYIYHPIHESDKFDNLPLHGTMQETKIQNPILAMFKHFWADAFDGDSINSENHSYYVNYYICSFAKSKNDYLNKNYPSPERGDGYILHIEDSKLPIDKNSLNPLYIISEEEKDFWRNSKKGDKAKPPDITLGVSLCDVDYDESKNQATLTNEINCLYDDILRNSFKNLSSQNLFTELMKIFDSYFQKWQTESIIYKPRDPFEQEDEIRLIISKMENCCETTSKLYIPNSNFYFTFGETPDRKEKCFFLHYENCHGFINKIEKP